MEHALALALRSLLESQQVASLATLHKGEPAVSMVPYALLPAGAGFIVHVSRLAAHTADMQAHPSVGLMVMASPGSASSAQEIARASVQGTARPCAAGSEEHAAARTLYLARFPQSEPMFGFADFSLFVIEPRSVRFVAGFGRAGSILAEEFSSVMGA
jgi:putative heme iron utilization protein